LTPPAIPLNTIADTGTRSSSACVDIAAFTMLNPLSSSTTSCPRRRPKYSVRLFTTCVPVISVAARSACHSASNADMMATRGTPAGPVGAAATDARGTPAHAATDAVTTAMASAALAIRASLEVRIVEIIGTERGRIDSGGAYRLGSLPASSVVVPSGIT